MLLYAELKRRNVFRVAIAYLAAAWLLSEVAISLFPLFGFGDTPARIVVILLAIGFPLFLVFSWVFEFTPEGLKLEKDVRREESITAKTGKTLDRTIIVLLILAVGYFAVDKFILEPERVADIVAETVQQARSDALVESYGEKSIAVLPFANMSADPEQEYFSDGIAEELLNLLTKVPELRVISRSSAFSFKGKELDIPTIAERLNVAHILEGSVRKSDNQVRITAQLIEARSDTHLWSETYDRTLEDIFTVQDEIASEVVRQLKITLLGGTPKVEVTDPEAYMLTMQGQYFQRLGTQDSNKQAIELYRQVLVIAPDYTEAWSGMGQAYINSSPRQIQQAREAWEQALALDPYHGTSYSRLSFISAYVDNDLAAAVGYMQRALELEPNNVAVMGNAANLLAALGRFKESVAFNEHLLVRDPVSPMTHFNMGIYYRFNGQYDEAVASFRNAIRLSPDYVGAQEEIGVALLLKDEPEAAMSAMAKVQVEHARVRGMALALHALGRQVEFEAAFKELRERWGAQRPLSVADVYAWIGDADRAFEWLDRAFQQNAYALARIAFSEIFNGIHDDPRWLPFLERIGMSPEQLAVIDFEVTLPE